MSSSIFLPDRKPASRVTHRDPQAGCRLDLLKARCSPIRHAGLWRSRRLELLPVSLVHHGDDGPLEGWGDAAGRSNQSRNGLAWISYRFGAALRLGYDKAEIPHSGEEQPLAVNIAAGGALIGAALVALAAAEGRYIGL